MASENNTFVRVVRGHANDPIAVRQRWWEWERPAATAGDGYLMGRCLRPPSRHLVEDAHRTHIWNKGGSDDAGFVQVRRGVSSNPARLRDLYDNQQPVRLGPYRPDVLGGLFAWHGDTRFTLSAYSTSEAAARRGENLHEFTSFYDDIEAVMQDVTYIDLRDPWLSSPRAPPPRTRQPTYTGKLTVPSRRWRP